MGGNCRPFLLSNIHDTQHIMNADKGKALAIEYRKALGEGLRRMRELAGITIHGIRNATGLSWAQVNAIEDGTSAYTVDSLLLYIQACNLYVFFGEKEGKQDGAIDPDHMTRVAGRNDPYPPTDA